MPTSSAVELAIGTDGRDALSLGGEACGGPVLDARTGAVLAVLGTALRAEHRSGGFAVAPRAAAGADPDGPLAALLERNAATVPAYGPDLNLAGVLELTRTTLGAALPPGEAEPACETVERPGTAAELEAFTAGDRLVLGLVGAPGTGRTTALAALAVRRARAARPAPTVWLRGADLHGGDASVADAVTRALVSAAKIASAAGRAVLVDRSAPDTDAGQAARVADAAGRALLVVLDAPEEMPPELAHRLGAWTAATVGWLRAAGARLAVAARPEHWERVGALCPPEVLYAGARPSRRMPPALPLGDLTPAEAVAARARFGIPEGSVRESDARHPLTLRLLAGIRAAGVTARCPGRDEVFAAHLDLLCLRAAVRIAAARPGAARVHGPGARRLAARAADRVHEAARRCLWPGQGSLDPVPGHRPARPGGPDEGVRSAPAPVRADWPPYWPRRAGRPRTRCAASWPTHCCARRPTRGCSTRSWEPSRPAPQPARRTVRGSCCGAPGGRGSGLRAGRRCSSGGRWSWPGPTRPSAGSWRAGWRGREVRRRPCWARAHGGRWRPSAGPPQM
ncbi:hypothetical protein [Streptomyces sp. NPDC006463]|uniref:hypothetical protein n=1 Tax=Streptomyces sp. NPDC006463 TaxID=3364746 RepID=UPI0036B0CE49